jgi:peptide/nickel transport system ATP-binding protein
MTPLLAVENLVVRYPVSGAFAAFLAGRPARIDAVAGVTFRIAAGETFALVGESGSGKTTVARAIAGLAPAAAGSIRFEGRGLAGLSRFEWRGVRRRMAIMFQDPVGSLSPRLTVRSLLAEPYRVHGLAGGDLAGKLAALLEKVGLSPDFLDRYPHQLSGGQARRVNVARALALEPSLLIVDEPTAGLDVSVQGDILNLLNDLQERFGLAILLITHNLHVVRHVAHRLAIMYLGRFVEQGSADDIFKAARHPYAAALLAASPEPDPDARRSRIELAGEAPSLFERPGGCEFHPRCPFVREHCRAHRPCETQDARGHAFTCHYPMGEMRRLAPAG